MANRYWVGGSGSWTDTAHWSATSGGSSGASVPNQTDDVFVDANSASGTFTITATSTDASVLNFSAAGLNDTCVIAMTATYRFFIYGNFIGSANLSFSGGSSVGAPFFYEQSNTGATRNITWNGVTGDTVIKFNENMPRGTIWYLLGAFVSNQRAEVLSGTFNTNSQSVDLFELDCTDQAGGSVILGTSTIAVQSGFHMNPARIVAGSGATIKFYGSGSKTFIGADKTYGKLWNTGTGTLSIPIAVGAGDYNLANIVNELQLDPDTTTSFGAVHAGNRQSLTVMGALHISGTSGHLVTINTLLAGNYVELYTNQGLVSADYLSLKDTHAITSSGLGSTLWYAGTHSTDVSGNSGWIFTAPPADVSTIVDHFNSYLTAIWNSFNTVTFDGTLKMDVAASTSQYAGVTSDNLYSLYNNEISVRVVAIGSQASASWEVYPINIYLDSSNGLFWYINQGTLYAKKKVAGSISTISSATFNAVTHRFLRLRESAGTTLFETSSDFVTWSVFASLTNPFAVSPVTVEIKAGASNTSMGSGNTARIDSVNVPTFVDEISGTFLLGGTVVRPELVHYRAITGTFLLGASLAQIEQHISQTTERKTFVYKIYDHETGDYLGEWKDVVSEFGFSQEINSAGSAIDVTLARNSDSTVQAYDVLADDDDDPIVTDDEIGIATELQTVASIGPGTNVDLNLDVKIFAFSKDLDPEGVLVFTGYISKYTAQYGQSETTMVTIFSYGAELDNWVLEDSGDTRVPYLSQDPSDILKDTLDKFNVAGGVVSYDGASIDDTSTSVSYPFNLNTELEVIKVCLKLAPSDWFFYVDMATNLVHFHERPTIPAHYFVLGKHILELNLEKYIEDITNLVYFTGGDVGGGINLFKKYENATSITDFRRGLDRIQDERVKLESSADVIVGSLIDRAKQPLYRSSITIADSVYPIETIKLGDLIGFRNFGNFVDEVTMQVVRIDYKPDQIALQLDTLLPTVPKRLEDIKRNLNQEQITNNPDAPDV
jgi:hypothetical protein